MFKGGKQARSKKEVTLQGRIIKFKGVHTFYKIIKIPTYILAIICLFSSMSTLDFTGIFLSFVVLGLVATLGNDLKLISNFSIH